KHVKKRVPVEKLRNAAIEFRYKDTKNLSDITRDVLFYDIPAESKVEEIHNIIGKVKMQLNKYYESKFLNDEWQIAIGIGKKRLVRWSPGSMTLKQRRLRDKHQVVKNMEHFPVKFTT